MSYLYANARLDIARPRKPSAHKLKRMLRSPVTTLGPSSGILATPFPSLTDAEYAQAIERTRGLTLSRKHDK